MVWVVLALECYGRLEGGGTLLRHHAGPPLSVLGSAQGCLIMRTWVVWISDSHDRNTKDIGSDPINREQRGELMRRASPSLRFCASVFTWPRLWLPLLPHKPRTRNQSALGGYFAARYDRACR